ncbi:MAG TPA: hypothetical protein VGR18_14545 [Rubrobacter sp.]|nr:hypothetical protein [Rubrobacter sp.]
MDDRGESRTAWEDLARTLGGSFGARARGAIAPELILLTRDGEPFGRLTADEDGRTHLQAGGLAAWIEPLTDATYGMTTGDERTLTAETVGSATTLTLRSGDRAYEARISLLRNSAVARSSDEGEAARVSGGLTNRRYRAVFDPEDPASLPVAVFLLHHTFALRSRAYRAGS